MWPSPSSSGTSRKYMTSKYIFGYQLKRRSKPDINWGLSVINND